MELITITNIKTMKKKKYLVPEVVALAMELGSTFICASGENLVPNSHYTDNYTEDEFWD